jgi:hypothetical protein
VPVETESQLPQAVYDGAANGVKGVAQSHGRTVAQSHSRTGAQSDVWSIMRRSHLSRVLLVRRTSHRFFMKKSLRQLFVWRTSVEVAVKMIELADRLILLKRFCAGGSAGARRVFGTKQHR